MSSRRGGSGGPGDYGRSEAHASEQGQEQRSEAPGQGEGVDPKGILSDDKPGIPLSDRSGGGQVDPKGVIVGGDTGGETPTGTTTEEAADPKSVVWGDKPGTEGSGSK